MLRFFILFWCCLGVDVVSKALAQKINGVVPVIDGFFDLTCIYNKGMAWGLGEKYLVIFIAFGLVATIVITVYAVYVNKVEKDIFLEGLLGIILGGVVGNCIERILFGQVTDFLSFTFGSYHFPIFNFADICITCGIIVFMVYINVKEHRKSKNEPLK